ncbi:small, acid-soluble spore protein, alpha/beta type [Abyssisolibacter fermentans]|uniref:small, acid-soluble spore protein, alpha/beta type n=1 Tax=Abyssisolibacter fermentans TaxID=1766203 RepID=UPI0009EAEA6C|nr:small, acid-soluble spore protein, alpha/beta type [Abyssisolibacter fermentans]
MNKIPMKSNFKEEFGREINPTSRLIGSYAGRVGGQMTRKLVEMGEKQLMKNDGLK